MKGITRFIGDQSGLATIEYALLLSLIGLTVAIAMSALASAVSDQLNDMSNKIDE